ncbi:MAG: hypothetical protein PHI15_09600 [Methanomicrobium sp.]|jgi:uncharacterized protein YigA (DUF484 family)|nr:hypothetical protein [Methanomicrobium sp.]
MKDLSEIATVRNLRSMHSIGARSVPKVQRSPYLDLYVLKKEKDRLEKEMTLLEKRKKINGRLLSGVSELINRLQTEVQEDQGIKTIKHTKSNTLRTMPIKY